MDVLILGAGRPATGDRPSALKQIAQNTTAIDWQIHSVRSVFEEAKFHFLGGYHVEEVIDKYPELSFTVVPDWEEKSVLHTLLHSPALKSEAIITYSDTVFRRDVIEGLRGQTSDIVVGIDLGWENRYASRSSDDIKLAETIQLEMYNSSKKGFAEFSGLVYLNPQVAACLSELDGERIGSSLLDLLNYLKSRGFSIDFLDVANHWAELNSTADIARFILGTKAETLDRLRPLVRKSHIGIQVNFSASDWREDSRKIIDDIRRTFESASLIVRSSARGEDNWDSSNAGGFESRLNVDGGNDREIAEAINAVVDSYGSGGGGENQVLVQAFLQEVQCSGVVFTCGLDTGAPYYRINFDDKTQSTESVTGGTENGLRTIILHRAKSDYIKTLEPAVSCVIDAVIELEELLGFDKLDIEFAIDVQGIVQIFQVRPVTVDHRAFEVDDRLVSASLLESERLFILQRSLSPFIFGKTPIFGNMPDWNPAEIIGAKPKPLAFSLYRQLITNETWAVQRAEFGYRDVRPCPLIVSFSGHPYVDVRASFNSFIPAALGDESAKRLVRAYSDILLDNPEWDDKIEFEIAFTVWTPGYRIEAKRRLIPRGVYDSDIAQLECSLKAITRNAFKRLGSDVESIDVMIDRCTRIETSDLGSLDKAFALLDDCRRLGTLAFSHAARAGFVATTLLNSFVSEGILSDKRRFEFLKSVRTVAGEFGEDKLRYSRGHLNEVTLIERYGHLRPGTYDITAQAYWEDPARFLLGESFSESVEHTDFELSLKEHDQVKGVLFELEATLNPYELFEYLKNAIQSREAVKFEFTRNLSRALDACIEFFGGIGFSREEISFLDYHDLEQFKLNAINADSLRQRVENRRRSFVITQMIELPKLIKRPGDFYGFERQASLPNFVTTKKIVSEVTLLGSSDITDVKGKIVVIPQADPGYDWLFGCDIVGLITKYGGANSHMAIRAAEIGLPSAIGVGEELYERIIQMKKAELDCSNQWILEAL
jgi:glutamine kinase